MKRYPLIQIHVHNYEQIIKYLTNPEINKKFVYEYDGIIKVNDIFYITLKCSIPEFQNLVYNFGSTSFITSMSDIEHGIYRSMNYYYRFSNLKNFSKNNFEKIDQCINVEDIITLSKDTNFLKQKILNLNPEYTYDKNNKTIIINDPFRETNLKINKKIHYLVI